MHANNAKGWKTILEEETKKLEELKIMKDLAQKEYRNQKRRVRFVKKRSKDYNKH